LHTLVWSPKAICSLFDVDWESTQLFTLMKELDIPLACSVSGGAVVRTLLKQNVLKGDIDIFAHTEQALERAIEQYSKEPSWKKAKHAYNFEFGKGVYKAKVQVITKDKPSIVGDTFKNFDFEHCKIGILSGKEPVAASKCAFKAKKNEEHGFVTTMASPICLAKKELRLGLVRDPNYSMGRAIKYKRLGFDADKTIEQLAAMSIKGMKDVQCYDKDDWSCPVPSFEIDDLVATCSS
jgi:hypothetical protein